jgi:hypothetical protein
MKQSVRLLTCLHCLLAHVLHHVCVQLCRTLFSSAREGGVCSGLTRLVDWVERKRRRSRGAVSVHQSTGSRDAQRTDILSTPPITSLTRTSSPITLLLSSVPLWRFSSCLSFSLTPPRRVVEQPTFILLVQSESEGLVVQISRMHASLPLPSLLFSSPPRREDGDIRRFLV